MAKENNIQINSEDVAVVVEKENITQEQQSTQDK